MLTYLVENYDTLVLCRYPDSLRIPAENMNLIPWSTELIYKNTKSPKNPARFILKIDGNKSRGDTQKKLIGAAAVKVNAFLIVITFSL